jgi:hypothetical protein
MSQLERTFSATAQNYRDIAEMGGHFGRLSFRMYQAFAIAETTIKTIEGARAAAASVAGIPYIGQALAAAAYAAFYAAGMLNVATIASQKVPSYDDGGISSRPGLYYAGVEEAHIPLKTGKVPVEITGGMEQQPIYLENHLTVELDGEALGTFISRQIYERTKDGDQIVHTRGITTI